MGPEKCALDQGTVWKPLFTVLSADLHAGETMAEVNGKVNEFACRFKNLPEEQK